MASKFPASTRWAFNFKGWQPTEHEWCNAIMQLQEEERIRIGKFRYRDDAKSSLVGRLMIRRWSEQFLSAFSSIDSTLTIARTEKGRPKLLLSPSQTQSTKDTNFDFNVAHAGEFTVFAAEIRSTTNVTVGVDVMPLTNRRKDQNVEEFLRLMKRQFTSDEWAQIRRTPSDYDEGFSDTLKNFYRFWCLKESFVKAEGSGLAWNLQRLSFNCPTADLNIAKVITDTSLAVDGTPLDKWQFQEHILSPNHCAVVAVNYEDINRKTLNHIPFQFVTVQDLLKQEISNNDLNNYLNLEDRKKEWEIFISKELYKPF